MNQHIGIFEKLARQLIEGAFERPFGQRRLLRDIARNIAINVEKNALENMRCHQYSIQLHPDTIRELLEASPNLQFYLEEYLTDLAREYNLLPPDKHGLRLISNPEMERYQVTVRAEPNSATRELTMRGYRPSEKQVQAAIEKIDAFLILDGKRHIEVRQPIITIGRHLDSDIVLSDSAVSRQHIQLRWQHDRFILFDLGSKGGTSVNNMSVSQHALINGDVIRLGQSALIYGEETSRDGNGSSTPDTMDGSTRQLPGRNIV